MNWKILVCALMASAVVVACGGGGNAGTPAYGNTSTSTTSTGTTGTNVSSNSSGSVILSLSASNVSASQPSTVTAVVKDASGNPIANALVQFAISGSSSSIAQLSPASAITDSTGQAATTLTPAPGATSGAALVTAAVTTSAGSLTAQSAFSVSATNVTLSGVTASPASIATAYGSTAINITVSGASTNNPVTLNISSTCATNGKATISPSSLTVTGAGGSVTYQDKGCAATDGVNVQIAGTTQQRSVSLVVAAPSTQAIQYVSVDRTTICLVGSGCPSTANVTFKVVDSSGNGKPGVGVSFALDSGSQGFATLGATSGTTASDGTVSVSVSSDRTPLPLRVQATVISTSIQTVSNQLTISGGLPVAGLTDAHNHMSLSATKYSLNNNLDGDSTAITLHLSDQWSAPVIDGTAVSLVSDGGTVVPAYCLTASGACTVSLVVSNPRPTNGHVHIVAYAKGQEWFQDDLGTGVYSSTGDPTYDDVPVGVCLDTNENGGCGQFVVGVNVNPTAGNGQWDGSGAAYVRKTGLFFFSSTAVAPKLYQVDASGNCTSTALGNPSVNLGNQSRATIAFCVTDGDSHHSNVPIVSGATISANASNTTYTATVSNSPVPAAVPGPTVHTVIVQNASTATPQTSITAGTLDLVFNLNGQNYTFYNLISVH